MDYFSQSAIGVRLILTCATSSGSLTFNTDWWPFPGRAVATFGEGERALAGTVPQALAKWQVSGQHSERQWLVDYQVHMCFYTNVFRIQ